MLYNVVYAWRYMMTHVIETHIIDSHFVCHKILNSNFRESSTSWIANYLTRRRCNASVSPESEINIDLRSLWAVSHSCVYINPTTTNYAAAANCAIRMAPTIVISFKRIITAAVNNIDLQNKLWLTNSISKRSGYYRLRTVTMQMAEGRYIDERRHKNYVLQLS